MRSDINARKLRAILHEQETRFEAARSLSRRRLDALALAKDYFNSALANSGLTDSHWNKSPTDLADACAVLVADAKRNIPTGPGVAALEQTRQHADEAVAEYESAARLAEEESRLNLVLNEQGQLVEALKRYSGIKS